MRWKTISLSALVIALLIPEGACRAEDPGQDSPAPVCTHTVTGEYNTGVIELLKTRIIDETFKDINSILVVRHGKIIIEEYFNGSHPETLHDIRSAGKSVTSALVGIAIDRGLINGVDEKLFYYFPGVECNSGGNPAKDDITLEHLLSMSFGLTEPVDSSWESFKWYTRNWIDDILCRPVAYAPGSRFDYDTAAPALFGPILEQASGMTVGQFAGEFLFKPIGVEHYRFRVLPDGREYTGGNFRMRPRDMARFGQLYLQKGVWNGEQVISRKWIEESTRAHLIADAARDQYYGYYWWREKFQIDNRLIETYFASGNGGNKIYVFPTEDLVVVVTAAAYDRSYGHRQVRMMMNKYILPAVIGGYDSISGKPVLKTVPKTGFMISEIIFILTILLCIIWRPEKTGCKRKGMWYLFTRVWMSMNALAGTIFVGIVLDETDILNQLLNTGYPRPILPAVHKVIATWAITVLTAGSILLVMKSWRVRSFSKTTRIILSIFSAVSLFCVLSLWHLGLLFLTL